jgi:hypothetical protein
MNQLLARLQVEEAGLTDTTDISGIARRADRILIAS